MPRLEQKLRDLDLIARLYDIIYSPRYGTAEDEVDAWDGLIRWIRTVE